MQESSGPRKKAKTLRAMSFSLALLTARTAIGDELSDKPIPPSTGPAAAADTTTKYLLTHRIDAPLFITSVERTGPCNVRGSPVDSQHLAVPYQIYPAESLRNHEEGTVRMQLIFDSNWCVRKATIVESSAYWRLDQVSLQWAMAIKWTPIKTLLTPDGEPTVTIPVAWGESQRKQHAR